MTYIIGAHLKSKRHHHLGQSDIRRYEARQLQYFINGILDKDADANVLLLGDLNDSPNSSPIKTLLSRNAVKGKRLYELRPVDSNADCWTHLWFVADVYSRFDYALASFGLLPEVALARSRIPNFPNWLKSSDHRPLLITITATERPANNVLSLFPKSVYWQTKGSGRRDADGRIISSRKSVRE